MIKLFCLVHPGRGALVQTILVVMALLAGCAAPMAVFEPTTPWYMQPSGAYDIDSGKVFYGVGKATALKNRTLQRVNADNNARLALARLLDAYINDLAQTASYGDNPEELTFALKALLKQAMQHAIVTDHWMDPEQGQLFALCRLDLLDFNAVLNDDQLLDADMRAAMQGNLEEVHDQLSQELFEK